MLAPRYSARRATSGSTFVARRAGRRQAAAAIDIGNDGEQQRGVHDGALKANGMPPFPEAARTALANTQLRTNLGEE